MALNARHANLHGNETPRRLNHIKYLSQPVGSGKTSAVISDIRDNQNLNYIYVAPTRELARQIKNRLDIALIDQSQGDNVHLIITDDDDRFAPPVMQTVLATIANRRRDQAHTLVITTEAFRNILPRIPDHQKADYNVLLDEGIDALVEVEFATRHQGMFLEPIDIGDDGKFEVTPEGRELLEVVGFKPDRLAELGREDLKNQNYIKLAKLLVSGIYDVYGVTLEQSIRAVAFLRPVHFLAFNSVTMIMAIFNQSLLALFWREKYSIDFQEYYTDHDLFDTHTIKGPRLRLHYLLHPDDGASRYNLERHWESGATRADQIAGERVIDRAAIAIEARFSQVPYCWAANNFYLNHLSTLSGVRMPTICAGLDNFKRFDVVVSMTCINPKPWVKNIVTQHIRIADDDLYELWRLSHTYQTIGRCSLRDRDSDRWIDVVVVSHDCAIQIAELFPGAVIVGQLTDLPSYEGMRLRRGPGRNPSPYTRADTAAWKRYEKSHPEYEGSKEDWFRDIRVTKH